MISAHHEMVRSVCAAFRSAFGDDEGAIVVMAPGRVNLIGEYTDFNDGCVFPMTVDRGVYVAIRPRRDRRVRVASVRYDELIEYEPREFDAPKPGHWSSYVLGVVEELRLRGLIESGFEAVVDGNLNLGAGLSSSAALEIATAVSLQQVFGFDMSRVDIVKLCQHVEHKYARVLCGIMDQFACGLGLSGHALLLDCRSLNYENIPVRLGEYRIIIINSGVKRSLASSAYNTRRAECQKGVEYFNRYECSVRALCDVSAKLLEAHNDGLTPLVRRRCRHVIGENQRTLDAAAALRVNNFERLGELMSTSHRSLRDDFDVSCPELDLLVELAEDTPGVLGSRMTGAGFGGCTVSLAHRESVELLANNLSAYSAEFDLEPSLLVLEENLEAGPVAALVDA